MIAVTKEKGARVSLVTTEEMDLEGHQIIRKFNKTEEQRSDSQLDFVDRAFNMITIGYLLMPFSNDHLTGSRYKTRRAELPKTMKKDTEFNAKLISHYLELINKNTSHAHKD